MSDAPHHNQFLSAWKKSLSDEKKDAAENVAPKAAEPMESMFMENESDVLSGAPVQMSKKMPFFKKKGFIVGLSVTLLLLLGVGSVAGFVGFGVYKQAQDIKAEMMEASVTGRAAYTALKTQNLVEAKSQLKETQSNITQAEEKFKGLSWMGGVPLASKYYEDGVAGFVAAQAGVRAGLKVVEAVEPHADVLGFSGEGTFTGGTTEDRIGLILKTLSEITPVLDSVADEMKIVDENLAKINPNDYPEELSGYKVREMIVQANTVAAGATTALTEFRPVLEKLPEVAGATGRKKYLVLFQNDNELRPTGGFLTAYAVVFVENGKVTPEKSDDIYELDKKFAKKPPIPAELGRFLVSEKKWNLRDMNIDPNFENSMKTFHEYYKQVPGEPQNIDGIIAVDTNILERIVNILGPVEVPGYGTFSSQITPICDCPQIIYALSEIIDRPTPYLRENRKGILAPMMQSILAKTYATSRDKWPKLAELVWQGVEGRHVQFYFLDPEIQAAAKTINATGDIPKLPSDGSDFLAVVDANLAGAKSNLFVDIEGIQKIKSVENGRLTKEVELTYRNDHAPSNCNLEAGQLCLNGLLNDWTRWYVPKGSQIVDVLGLEPGYKLDTSHDGYDVIEGIFRLAPKSQTKVRITYTVPYTWEKGYKGTMQKQGGVNTIPYSFETPWGEKEVNLDKDVTVMIGQ